MKLSLSLLLVTSTNAFAPSIWQPRSRLESTTPLYYDIQRDNDGDHNVWSVLATTEKWIASTLKEAAQEGNPLTRKEVSYVCETSNDSAMVLANVFRKLKEARLMGESHAQEQEGLVDETKEGDEGHLRATLRQTQVLVIPANSDLMSFPVFDQVMEAINQARRSARDLVTDVSLEKLDERMYGEGDRDWCVSVNCAHLHPKYGELTLEQQLKQMQEQDQEGEVDLNLQEYKQRRLSARRSPYPSVVVEVRAMPPPEFTPPPPSGPTTPDPIEDIEPPVTSEFIQELEALFSKSTLQKEDGGAGGFYDSLGSHLEEVSTLTPMNMAQNWIAEHDPLFEMTTCAFTTSDTAHVDAAYEFAFVNLAMQTSQFLPSGKDATSTSSTTSQPGGAQKRQYLVLSNFVTSSATSLEKFAMQFENILEAVPVLRNKVGVSVFHPEHIDAAKRCPVPVLVLQWNEF